MINSIVMVAEQSKSNVSPSIYPNQCPYCVAPCLIRRYHVGTPRRTRTVDYYYPTASDKLMALTNREEPSYYPPRAAQTAQCPK